jgi:HSP20 family protein
MANITRYDPFRDAMRLSDAMNRLFEQSFVRPLWGVSGETAALPVDVRETEQGYEVKAQLPGVKPEDIELTLRNNALTVKAQYASDEQREEQGRWQVREIRRGSFVRTIPFDKQVDVDKVTTSYEHGELKVVLPVHEAEQPKRIEVKSSK